MTLRTSSLRTVSLLSLLALFVVAGCSDLGAPLILRPQLVLSETAVGFGTLSVADSVTRVVTLGNSGNADLHGNASVSCDGFSIVSGGGAFTVPPNGSHAIAIRFRPPGVGDFACELALGAGLPGVPMSGSGAQQSPGAACKVSVDSLAFGGIASGSSKILLFKVYSTGTAPVSLDVIAGCSAFSILGGGGPRVLPPGDSLAVTVGFAPSSGGRFTCTVSTGAGCPSVSLSGTSTTVSFNKDLVPILTVRQCTVCHGYSRASDLVNVNSFTYSAPLIRPFDPNGSVLYAKIANRGTYGPAMPQGTTGLSAVERKLWFDWISEGALDN